MLDATGLRERLLLARSSGPPEVAAIACIWLNTQLVAAPMPRTGSVWLDAVCAGCRKLTMPSGSSALIRSGSMSRSNRPQGPDRVPGG